MDNSETDQLCTIYTLMCLNSKTRESSDFGDVRILPQQEITDSVRDSRATLIGDYGDVDLVRDLGSVVMSHPFLLTPAHLCRVLGIDHLSFNESVNNCKTGVWH